MNIYNVVKTVINRRNYQKEKTGITIYYTRVNLGIRLAFVLNGVDVSLIFFSSYVGFSLFSGLR